MVADDGVLGELQSIGAEMMQEAEQAAAAPEKSLVELAEEYAVIVDTVNQLAAEAKSLSSRKEELRKKLIPDAMRAAGMVAGNKGSFTFTLGKIHLETKSYPSIKADEAEAFLAWLRETGQEAMIVTTQAVPAATLKSLINERREEGLADPPHVEVYEETACKFMPAKR